MSGYLWHRPVMQAVWVCCEVGQANVGPVGINRLPSGFGTQGPRCCDVLARIYSNAISKRSMGSRVGWQAARGS
jgi:hypothetical protein